MKKLSSLIIAIMAITLCLALPALSQNKPAVEKKDASNTTVAVVNGVAIYEKELNFHLTQAVPPGQQIPPLALSRLKIRILENLINSELVYQESQKKGIIIESRIVEDKLKSIKRRFPSEAEFKKALKKAGFTEASFKSAIKRDLIIGKLIDKEVIKKIIITDEETRAYYNDNQIQFKKPKQIKARHILIRVSPTATEAQKAEARKKIEKIQQRLKNGEDFGALAKELSEGPSNANGGDLGYFQRGVMVKPFEDAAFALDPGQISNIVKTKFGYHLIKVEDVKPESIIAYAKVKDRLSQYLKKQKIEKEISAYINTLREGAKIERYL